MIVTLAVLGGLAVCGATVKLGDKTFFQHVAAIWASDETQDLVEGVKETAAPTIEKMKKGVQAGLEDEVEETAEDAAKEKLSDALKDTAETAETAEVNETADESP